MLYLVPTPLGNLEDMTQRAVKTLQSVRAVYCEDTRRTRTLMSHLGISKPLKRYDDRQERAVAEMLEALRGGQDLALVSDSGTPCVSDPGLRIVQLARENGIPVTVLPGPAAVTTAVAGSGLPGDSFVFLGFLPRSASRRLQALKEAATLGRTIVLYESPFRVVECLAAAEEVLGGGAQACVTRELSKVHEEWLRGTIAQVRATLENRPELLGEFVVVLHPREAHGRDH